jgi:urea carboxylase-associated protein 2
MTYSHDVPGGAAWSVMVRRHRSLRLEALGAGANASVLIYAAGRPAERLNVPDTLKAQMSVRVTPPMVLMSDMGRALCSVTGSSLEWHDAICGHSLDVHVPGGPSTYAEHRNERRRSARAGLLDELWKHGLDERDLHACVNFFSRVVPGADERGALAYVHGHASAGDWVELRAEQDVLIVLATSPHPLNPSPDWAPAAVRATVRPVEPPGDADPSRSFRAESARALEQAERSTL